MVKPLLRHSKSALYVIILLAITLANLLFFMLPQSAQAASTSSQHSTSITSTSQRAEPPAPCPLDANGVPITSTYECIDPNSIACSNGGCYSCDMTTCTTYPNPITIQQKIALPMWKDNNLFVETPKSLTVDMGAVQTIWGWSLGVSDILALVLIALGGIRIMITGSIFRRAEAATAIPNVLLGLICAHLSLALITVMLSLGDTLSTSFYNWAGTYGGLAKNTTIVCDAHPNGSTSTMWLGPMDAGFADLLGGTKNILNYLTGQTSMNKFSSRWITEGQPEFSSSKFQAWDLLVQESIMDNATTAGYNVQGWTDNLEKSGQKHSGQNMYPEIQVACHFGGFSGAGDANVLTAFQTLPDTSDTGFIGTLKNAFKDMWNSFMHFAQVLFQISTLALLGQMIGRFLIIDFFIVTSPLALAGWSLPGRMGQGLTNAWFKGFSTTVLMQFLQVMALVIGETCLSTIQNTIFASMHLTGSSDTTNTVNYVVGIVFVWLIIRIPSMMGSSAVNLVMEMGQQGSRTIGAMVGHGMQEGQMIMNAGMMGAGGLAIGL